MKVARKSRWVDDTTANGVKGTAKTTGENGMTGMKGLEVLQILKEAGNPVIA